MFKYISKILYIIPDNKSNLILLVLIYFLISLLEICGIGLIIPFLSLATDPNMIERHNWLYTIYIEMGLSDKSQFISFLGILIIFVFCIKSFINWRAQLYAFKFSFVQQSKLISKLMHYYLTSPYSFLLDKNSATIIQNIIDETRKFTIFVLTTLLISVSNIVIIISFIALLLLTNLLAVLGILIILIPIYLLYRHFKDKLKHWGEEASRSNENIIRIVNHGLGSIKETQILGCGSFFEDQIAEHAHRYSDARVGIYAFKLSPRIIIEASLVIFLVGFTSILLFLQKDTQELMATLGVFALASIRLIPAISNFAGGMSTLRNSIYTVNKLYDDLKNLEDVKHEKELQISYLTSHNRANLPTLRNNQELEFTRDIIINSINYRYPNVPETTLQNISLTIKKGESIAFIGKSGAGKTTLVDVILGLLIPESGDIKVDGRSIYHYLSSWQNLVGYIPQSIFLIDDTIERNIAFGIPDPLIDPNRLNDVIEAAQLKALVDDLPDGLHTMVGERGVRLSGGERQRIGIARALYHGQEILVLDEATAALDHETESLVTEAIKSLSGTKTMIMIAHRLTTVEHCDRLYLMENGRILKSGPYEEIVLGHHLSPAQSNGAACANTL